MLRTNRGVEPSDRRREPADRDAADGGAQPTQPDRIGGAPARARFSSPKEELASHVPVSMGPELEPGTMVGDYRIEAKIGQGGMGVVYRAIHPLIGKRAAIKVLRLEFCQTVGIVERFIDEARVVNAIGHPNLVDVFGFGELACGRRYMIMEWLNGEPLSARIQRGMLSLSQIISVLRSLARALQAAHGKGVVHRDLKPDNVFLVEDPDGEPELKLLDFGIAKLANTQHRVEQTLSGMVFGTPKYMAPEQALGQAVDQRADVYALGLIAFELFVGRPPFQANSTYELVSKHLTEPAPRASAIVSDVPEELDDVISAMLAKQPESRATLEDLLGALQQAEAGWPLRASDRSIAAPLQTGAVRPRNAVSVDSAVAGRRNRRRWTIVAAALVLAGAAGSGIAIMTSSDPPADSPVHQARVPDRAPDQATDPVTAPPPTPSPAGSDQSASSAVDSPAPNTPDRAAPAARPVWKPTTIRHVPSRKHPPAPVEPSKPDRHDSVPEGPQQPAPKPEQDQGTKALRPDGLFDPTAFRSHSGSQ